MAMPTLRTEVKQFLIVGVGIVFAAGYFQRFPLPDFLYRLFLFCLAGLLSCAAWGYGSAVLKDSWRKQITFLESIVISALVGFGMISTLMVILGAIRLWNRTGGVTLVAIGLLLGGWNYKRQTSPLQETAPGKSAFVPSVLILLGASLSLLIAFAPVTYYDSLVYHLALPQTYLQAKHWIGQPDLIYSAFPQTMEMLWTLGILLAGDTLANLVGWIIAMLGLLAVYAFGKRYFGEKTALWAAAILSVMPAYLLLSSGGYIDVGLAIFSFLSFYLICLWKETENAELLYVAGAFAGWAIGTKYTGAIPFAIGGLFIAFTKRSRVKNLSAYTLAALLVFSPWLIKNIYFVGNPVFPFFYQLSFKQMNPWLGQAAEGYFRGLTEYSPQSGVHLLKLIWDIAVNGLRFGGGMDVLGDLGWGILFAFLPAAGLIRKRSPMYPLLLLYALCFFVPWGMTRPVLRFLIPLAPILSLAAAYGYVEGLSSQKRWLATFGHLFLGLLISSGFLLFFEVTDTLSLFKVPLGFQSRFDYLSEKLDYFPAATFVNTLPPNSLTYIIGDQRGYYYNTPVLVTPVFNANPLTGWANQASSPKELAMLLKSRGVTHLMINRSEYQRLESAYHLFPFTSKGQANWDVLNSQLATRLYRDRHCEVLAL